jgi:hypothetical protein
VGGVQRELVASLVLEGFSSGALRPAAVEQASAPPSAPTTMKKDRFFTSSEATFIDVNLI